jgi:hypothetical protein
MLLQRGVQVGDVRLVVLSVMNLHRLRVDVRLESAEIVWKFWKLVRHESSSEEGNCVRDRLCNRRYDVRM